jgi:hypothetical protein
MNMIAWYWFWMIAVGLSAMLFFGVAVLVMIFGWRDLRDLYAQLQSDEDPVNPDSSRR